MAHNAEINAVTKGHQNPVGIAFIEYYAPFLFVNHPVKKLQLKKKEHDRNFLYLAEN